MIRVLFIILLFSTNAFAMSPVTIGGSGGSGSPADYSDITFWWRCENATLDGSNDYSIGDGVASLTGEAQIAAGGRTNNGVNLTDASNNGGDYYYIDFDVEEDLADLTTTGTLYFAFKLSIRGNYASLVSLYRNASNRVFVHPINTNELRVAWYENGTNHYFETTDVSFSLNTWYLVQVHWKVDSSDSRSLHVYNSSTGAEVGTGVTDTTDVNGFTLTTAAYMAIGTQGAVNQEGFIDDVRLSTDETRNFVLLRDTDSYP